MCISNVIFMYISVIVFYFVFPAVLLGKGNI